MRARDPANVLIISFEDSAADTIKPRLIAAGADLTRCHFLHSVHEADGTERQLELPADLETLRTEIKRTGAKLVIVDPLMASLAGHVKSHLDQDIRRVLSRLRSVAEETGATFLVIRHLNKSQGGTALYRGGGSIGIIGAARAAHLVAKDPDDEDKRILAPTKCNLAKTPPSISFRIEGAGIDTDDGMPITTARIRWLSEVGVTADALVAPTPNAEDLSAAEEARSFLREVLMGGPLTSDTIKAEARGAGVSQRTLWRAKAQLGVVAERRKNPAGDWEWFWRLPTVPPTMPTDRLGTLGRDDRDQRPKDAGSKDKSNCANSANANCANSANSANGKEPPRPGSADSEDGDDKKNKENLTRSSDSLAVDRYLGSRCPGSRGTVVSALKAIAKLAGFDDPHRCPWGSFSDVQISELKRKILEKYSTATAKIYSGILRRVVYLSILLRVRGEDREPTPAGDQPPVDPELTVGQAGNGGTALEQPTISVPPSSPPPPAPPTSPVNGGKAKALDIIEGREGETLDEAEARYAREAEDRPPGEEPGLP